MHKCAEAWAFYNRESTPPWKDRFRNKDLPQTCRGSNPSLPRQHPRTERAPIGRTNRHESRLLGRCFHFISVYLWAACMALCIPCSKRFLHPRPPNKLMLICNASSRTPCLKLLIFHFTLTPQPQQPAHRCILSSLSIFRPMLPRSLHAHRYKSPCP